MLKIGNSNLDTDVYVIAEIGGNHNGDPEAAFRLVEAAASTGADAVKFQSFIAERLVHPDAVPLPLAGKNFRTQQERFKGLELEKPVYEKIIQQCRDLGIDFLTTPFDLDTLAYFAPNMGAIKIASGDFTYAQLIDASVKTGKPVILSTGMAPLSEIKVTAQRIPKNQRIILHCVSVYPTPAELVDLRAIGALQKELPGTIVGFSDHSIGIEACIGAVALGARVIEKHFTLDRSQKPGDHLLSLEPDQMTSMVTQIRSVTQMLKSGKGLTSVAEQDMRQQMQRGVYYARNLTAGHIMQLEDFMIIRPKSELEPIDVEGLIGRPTLHSTHVNQAVSKEDFND